MPYSDPAKRREYQRARYAAKKEQLKLYGSTPPLTASGPDAVQELPVTADGLAAGFPQYQDEVFELDENAYKLIRQSPCTFNPINKAAQRIAYMQLEVVGEGPRQEIYQEIIDNMYGLKDAIKGLVWGFPEGVIFCHIKPGPGIDGLETGGWVLPDLRGGVRKKANAGGFLVWDGERIARQLRSVGASDTGQESQPANLERGEFIVFHPGSSGNPEGDLDLAVNLYKIARRYNKACKNLELYLDRFGVPVEILRNESGKMRPSVAASVLGNKAQVVADRRPGQTVGLTTKEIIELLEPKGTMAEILMQAKADCESEATKLILQNTLTTDTAESGPAGSSTVHMKEEDIAINAMAESLADCLTEDLLSWIVRNNSDLPEDGTSYHLKFVPMEPEEDMEEDSKDTPEEMPPQEMPMQKPMGKMPEMPSE